MQMIIEACVVDEFGETERARLAVIDCELSTDPLGMSLAEGKALLAATQRHFVEHRCRSIAAAHPFCDQCDLRLSIKGWHKRQPRTVFGRVAVGSLRIRSCACAKARAGASFSPLVQLVPARVTPELEYSQVRWAAHLSYGLASELLGEILPLDDSISVSGVKRRVRAGEAFEQQGAQASARADVHDQRTVRPEPR